MNKTKEKKALNGNALEEKNNNVKIDFDPQTTIAVREGVANSFGLDITNSKFIKFQKDNLEFEVIGEMNIHVLKRLQVTLKVSKRPNLSASEVHRAEVDLYNATNIKYYVEQASARLKVSRTDISDAIYDLTERLEDYRKNSLTEKDETFTINKLQPKQAKKVKDVLKSKNLIEDLKSLMSSASVVDAIIALQLFIISLSAKTDKPVHAVLQSSPEVTNAILKSQASFVAPEQLIALTSLSDNSLFYTTKNYLKHKVMMLSTIDTLSNKQNSLLEMIAQNKSNRLTSQANHNGIYSAVERKVDGPISLISASSRATNSILQNDDVLLLEIKNRAEIKKANATNLILESGELLNETAITDAQEFIQHMYREIEPLKVVNTYFDELDLLSIFNNDAKQIGFFIKLTNLITLLHQKQLTKKKANGVEYIEVKPEHMIIALELFRDVWVKDEDELSFTVARTYTSIKKELKKINAKAPQEVEFNKKEMRARVKIAPSTFQKHLNELYDYGKLERIGNKKIGYSYKVAIWETEVTGIKLYNELEKQLNSL